MEQRGSKQAAESVLRELPSVVGAFVREDAHGYPREIHLLIAAGPKPRHFAQDVRMLLEERLGITIDQRIISIAQLAGPTEGVPPTFGPAGLETPDVEAPEASAPPAPPTASSPPPAEGTAAARARLRRVRFMGAYSEAAGNRVTVRVRLSWGGDEYEGSAAELEAGSGRVRAGALALLRAVSLIAGDPNRFELEAAAVAHVLEREYAMVSCLAAAPVHGRRPVLLAGAHPLDDYAETAGALAALKAVNRFLAWVTEAEPPVRRGRGAP